MRNVFARQAIEEMESNPNIVFLTADLGFNALEPIKRRFPERFFNVGIAEANMVGMACGLAHEGKKVICYSIAAFVSLRAYEQIRLDVCYDNLDVKLVGAGGGFNYAAHGVTHHTIEDIAALSALPNLCIANPAFSLEAQEVTKTMLRSSRPCYARFGKDPGIAFPTPGTFALGKSYTVKRGKEIVLFSTGNLLERTLAVANNVEKRLGKHVGVISVPWIKPLDVKYLAESIREASGVFTVEEHNVIGGLGSLVAKFLAENVEEKKVFEAFGVQDVFHKEVGSRDYLLDVAGLGVSAMTDRICLRYKG